MTIGEFAEAVAHYCSLTGGSVTSWGRTEFRNVLVGGVEFSGHRFFRSADVIYDDDASDPQIAYVREKVKHDLPRLRKGSDVDRIELADRCGLFLVIEDDHDHLQPAGWRAG